MTSTWSDDHRLREKNVKMFSQNIIDAGSHDVDRFLGIHNDEIVTKNQGHHPYEDNGTENHVAGPRSINHMIRSSGRIVTGFPQQSTVAYDSLFINEANGMTSQHEILPATSIAPHFFTITPLMCRHGSQFHDCNYCNHCNYCSYYNDDHSVENLYNKLEDHSGKEEGLESKASEASGRKDPNDQTDHKGPKDRQSHGVTEENDNSSAGAVWIRKPNCSVATQIGAAYADDLIHKKVRFVNVENYEDQIVGYVPTISDMTDEERWKTYMGVEDHNAVRTDSYTIAEIFKNNSSHTNITSDKYCLEIYEDDNSSFKPFHEPRSESFNALQALEESYAEAIRMSCSFMSSCFQDNNDEFQVDSEGENDYNCEYEKDYVLLYNKIDAGYLGKGVTNRINSHTTVVDDDCTIIIHGKLKRKVGGESFGRRSTASSSATETTSASTATGITSFSTSTLSFQTFLETELVDIALNYLRKWPCQYINVRGLERYISTSQRNERSDLARQSRQAVIRLYNSTTVKESNESCTTCLNDMCLTEQISDEMIGAIYEEYSRAAVIYARMHGIADEYAAVTADMYPDISPEDVDIRIAEFLNDVLDVQLLPLDDQTMKPELHQLALQSHDQVRLVTQQNPLVQSTQIHQDFTKDKASPVIPLEIHNIQSHGKPKVEHTNLVLDEAHENRKESLPLTNNTASEASTLRENTISSKDHILTVSLKKSNKRQQKIQTKTGNGEMQHHLIEDYDASSSKTVDMKKSTTWAYQSCKFSEKSNPSKVIHEDTSHIRAHSSRSLQVVPTKISHNASRLLNSTSINIRTNTTIAQQTIAKKEHVGVQMNVSNDSPGSLLEHRKTMSTSPTDAALNTQTKMIQKSSKHVKRMDPSKFTTPLSLNSEMEAEKSNGTMSHWTLDDQIDYFSTFIDKKQLKSSSRKSLMPSMVGTIICTTSLNSMEFDQEDETGVFFDI